MPLPRPVIFVPGVTATNLRDLYPLPPETLWSLLRHDYDRAALHPEDQRYEARLPAQVRPDEVFEIAYREMILDLRHDLSPSMDRPVPVYAFGYDWRQPLEITQRQLASFVQEVINKTCLTRHYYADGYANDRKVSLVGHSMGGLVIAGYLADAAARGVDSGVARVATICTPFKGSLNIVEKMTIGVSSSREREAARQTPSLYYLIPSFKQGITFEAPLPQTDLFDFALWQTGVVETLREALRLRGSGAIAPTAANAERLLRAMLDQARAHRQAVDQLDLGACGLTRANWLCIIGIGDKTRVGLTVHPSSVGPVFDLLSQEMIDDEIADPPTWRTGDGTVPYEGALPSFPTVQEVYSRRDFRLLELKEKALDAVTALHGIIPNMDKLQRRLVNHLY